MDLSHFGLQALSSLDSANDRYHIPLQLLAQGIERLLKLTYVLGEANRSGQLPTQAKVKRFGHDVLALTDAIVVIARADQQFVSRPAVAADLDFIDCNDDLRRILKVLSHFGKQGRYLDLDLLLGEHVDAPGDGPEQAWQELESRFLQGQPDWMSSLATGQASPGPYRALAEHFAETLQRFLRAVCRMWTLGPLSEHGKRLVGIIDRFLFLTDGQLRSAHHPTRER